MKRLLLSVALFGVFMAKSPAPIRDDAHFKGPVPEQTQERLAQEQQLQGVQGVVGAVPQKTDDNGRPVDPGQNDGTAAQLVGNVGGRLNSHGEDAAAETVRRASQVMEEKQSGGFSWIAALASLGVGFGGVMAVKKYAEKIVPPMEPKPVKKKLEW